MNATNTCQTCGSASTDRTIYFRGRTVLKRLLRTYGITELVGSLVDTFRCEDCGRIWFGTQFLHEQRAVVEREAMAPQNKEVDVNRIPALLVFVAAFILTTFAASMARAESVDTKQYPIIAKERLSIGARAEFAFYSGDDEGPAKYLTAEVGKEWGLGVTGAYAMTGGDYPLSLVGGTVYALDSRFFRSWLGVNVLFFDGLRDVP